MFLPELQPSVLCVHSTNLIRQEDGPRWADLLVCRGERTKGDYSLFHGLLPLKLYLLRSGAAVDWLRDVKSPAQARWASAADLPSISLPACIFSIISNSQDHSINQERKKKEEKTLSSTENRIENEHLIWCWNYSWCDVNFTLQNNKLQ